jgi:hypothetical protein
VNIQGSSVVTIQYNTAYNTAQAWAIKPAGGIACTGTQSVTGGLIADNYSENIQGGVGDGENIELQGCATFPQSGVTVTRNVIVCGHDPNTGSLDAIGIFFSQGNFIYDNVLIGPCGPGKTGTTPRLIHASSSSSGNFYYHNVISGGIGASGHRGIIFGRVQAAMPTSLKTTSLIISQSESKTMVPVTPLRMAIFSTRTWQL